MKSIMSSIALAIALNPLVVIAFEPSQSDLEAAAKKGREIDPNYEERAIPIYFGPEAGFMQKCAPPGAAVAAPFTIYIAVSASGRIERQTSMPASAVADCMIEATSTRKLPAPNAALTLKLEMRFKN